MSDPQRPALSGAESAKGARTVTMRGEVLAVLDAARAIFDVWDGREPPRLFPSPDEMERLRAALRALRDAEEKTA